MRVLEKAGVSQTGISSPSLPEQGCKLPTSSFVFQNQVVENMRFMVSQPCDSHLNANSSWSTERSFFHCCFLRLWIWLLRSQDRIHQLTRCPAPVCREELTGNPAEQRWTPRWSRRQAGDVCEAVPNTPEIQRGKCVTLHTQGCNHACWCPTVLDEDTDCPSAEILLLGDPFPSI